MAVAAGVCGKSGVMVSSGGEVVEALCSCTVRLCRIHVLMPFGQTQYGSHCLCFVITWKLNMYLKVAAVDYTEDCKIDDLYLRHAHVPLTPGLANDYTASQ